MCIKKDVKKKKFKVFQRSIATKFEGIDQTNNPKTVEKRKNSDYVWSFSRF